MGKLVLFLADGTTLDIPLDHDRVTVGRRAGNDVCLPYPAVSASHAVFVSGPTGVVVEDLGSTNGTLVNGKRAAKHFLSDGDRIDIGRQALAFLADADVIVSPLKLGEVGRDRAIAGADGGGLELAPAFGGANGTDPRPDEAPSLAPAEAVTPLLPVFTPETWLSPLGPTGPTVVGNPAAKSMDARIPEMDAADDAAAARAVSVSALAAPVVKVLTGPSAGRMLALAKEEVLIGRVGWQVVAVRKVHGEHHLSGVEGTEAARVNGIPVPPEGVAVRTGDTIEIFGAQLSFLEVADPALPRT